MSRLCLFVATLALVGCSAARSDREAAPAHTLRGSARSPATGSTDATVSALRLGVSGELVAAGPADTQTDAAGEYTLALDDATTTALVVDARFADGSAARALVSGAASVGDVTFAPDLSAETDAEAEAWADVAAAGELDADTTGSMLRAFVTADVAAAWAETDPADRPGTADSLAAAVQAWEGTDADAADAAIAAMVHTTAAADAAGGASFDAAAELVAAWSAAGSSTEDLAYVAAAAVDAQRSVDAGAPAGEAEADLLDALHAGLVGDVVADAAAVLDGSAQGGASAVDVGALVDATVDGDLGSLAAGLGVVLDAAQAAAFAGELGVVADRHDALVAALDAASDEEAGRVAAEAMGVYRADVEETVAADLVAGGTFDADRAAAAASLLGQAGAVR